MEEEYALIFQPLNLIRPFAELEDNGNENLILEDVIIVEGKCIDFARRRRAKKLNLHRCSKGGCIDFASRRRENFENLLSNDS